MDEYPDVPISILATSIDYYLYAVYLQYKFVVMLFDANATTADYSISCWNCVYLLNQHKYNVVVGWTSYN